MLIIIKASGTAADAKERATALPVFLMFFIKK